jgi:hypothetical protein
MTSFLLLAVLIEREPQPSMDYFWLYVKTEGQI